MSKNELVGHLVGKLCQFKVEWLSVLQLLFDKLTVDGGDAVISALSQWMSADEVSITVDRKQKPILPSGFNRYYYINPEEKRPGTFSLTVHCVTHRMSGVRILSPSGASSVLEAYRQEGFLDEALTLQDGQAIAKLGTNVFTRVFGPKTKVLLLGSLMYFGRDTLPRVPCLSVNDDGFTLTISYPLITEIVFNGEHVKVHFKR